MEYEELVDALDRLCKVARLAMLTQREDAGYRRLRREIDRAQQIVDNARGKSG
ncbi:MAG: hypothetical protein KGL39_35180 [Patescibacteria group bacterium]|nr:hypothetical protein [Patescibacteria group bacterium]